MKNTKRIKVVHFIHGLTIGGAETLVKDYALMLDKDKFNVQVLCLYKYNTKYESQLKEKGIEVHYIYDELPKKKNKLFTLWAMFYTLLKTRAYIRKESPDIIHSHILLNAYLKFAKLRKDIRIFHTVHSEPKRYWNGREFWAILDFHSAKWLIKNYDMQLIALHENMRLELNKMFGVNNSIVLRNGVNFEKFKSHPDKGFIRKKIGIDRDSIVFGHVGRFVTVKNHDFLVDIYYELSKRVKHAIFLMVGTGEEKNSIMRKVSKYNILEQCIFLENRTDMVDIFNSMDYFVFPSIYEGMSLTLVEAQMAGIPCYVSDVINDETILSNGVYKISLKKSAAEWADIILNTKRIPIEYNNINEWDMNMLVKKLEQLYIKDLAERK